MTGEPLPQGYYYLAGPMRGYDEFNFPAFRAHAAQLRAGGFEIVSPAEKDEKDGFDWSGSKGTEEELAEAAFDISKTLSDDILLIANPRCLGVIAMERWEDSSGAKVEVAFAFATGRKVYEAVNTATSGLWLYPLTAFDASADFDHNEDVLLVGAEVTL